MRHSITVKVAFGCCNCKGTNLLSGGAVKTDENKIYLVYICEGCGEAVPIPIDAVIAALYGTTAVLSEGSKSVN